MYSTVNRCVLFVKLKTLIIGSTNSLFKLLINDNLLKYSELFINL